MVTGTLDRVSPPAAGEQTGEQTGEQEVRGGLLEQLGARCDSASRHLYAAGLALAGVRRPVAAGEQNQLIVVRRALETALRDLQDCAELVDELRSQGERCVVQDGGAGDPWQC